jgi:hypothetical protein
VDAAQCEIETDWPQNSWFHAGRFTPLTLKPETAMLGDLRHLLPLIIIGGSFTFTGVVLYGAWLLGRYHGRDEAAPLEFAQLEARLQRVEHTTLSMVDAMQRLEAANRFTTRLLTAPNSEPPRQTTPH